jgi:hypothetical protein
VESAILGLVLRQELGLPLQQRHYVVHPASLGLDDRLESVDLLLCCFVVVHDVLSELSVGLRLGGAGVVEYEHCTVWEDLQAAGVTPGQVQRRSHHSRVDDGGLDRLNPADSYPHELLPGLEVLRELLGLSYCGGVELHEVLGEITEGSTGISHRITSRIIGWELSGDAGITG